MVAANQNISCLVVIQNQAITTWKPTQQEIAKIYEYLQQYTAIEPSDNVIGEFRRLFLQGKSKNPQVNKALEKIVVSSQAEQLFNCLISYCYQLIIIQWSSNIDHHQSLLELLGLFDSLSSQPKSYDRRKAKLIQLSQNYQQTDSYSRLKSLVDIITYDGSKELDREALITTLTPRYTYLYQYFLLDKENIPQLKELIDKTQHNNQKRFEFQLSQHIIYRSRLVQAARINLLSKGAGKVIHRVENPLLLSEKDMNIAIRQYVGKFDGQHTLLELAQKFVARNQVRNSYQEFKQDLYQYLIYGIKPRNSSYLLNSKLQHKINNIFPSSDSRPLNSSLILQTCKQLFSFLLVEASTPINPNNFAELVINLGTAKTSALLIKILLICPEVKPDLEKKLALLFTYYQSHPIKDAFWLVKCLEHLLMAFSIYLGKIDVSIAKTI
ncbi:MAG: hypothetical protein Tsb0014_02320 [Pleurocapsa sp.]